MMSRLNLSAIAIGLGTALSMTALHTLPAEAANFSFRGTFSQDDNVQLFNFTVGAPSTVTLRSYSYAGGTQADGTVIPRGGFDPILALFDSTGARINQNDDGFPPNVPIDPPTGVSYDTFLQSTLAVGNYTVAVMQFNNFAGLTLSSLFSRQGQGNFTATSYPCGQSAFCDITRNGRTNAWAFDVLNVAQATQVEAVPEPLTVGGAMLAIGGLTAARRKRKQAALTKV